MSFTLRLTLVFVAAVVVAAILSPFVAAAAYAAGIHTAFRHISDRTVMIVLGAALIWQARELRVVPLLRSGYDRPLRNLPRATRGFLIAIVAMAALVFAAAAMGAHARETAAGLWLTMPKYLLAAVVIAIIEEGFFRAFLLGGMEGDFGRITAIVVSSGIYAIAHLVRSRSKVPVTGIHPLAGFQTIGLSLANLGHPMVLLPTFVGLFLLGIVLAEAFLRTGTVYFSIGLHAGFVVGAKMWPHMTSGGLRLPPWLGGYGPQPLISGVAAWAVAIALLLLIRPLTRTGRA